MGIQQLESFVESKVSEGMCRLVHLGPLAEQYMHQTGKKPILVVDGTYFVHHYYSRSGILRDFLCGGQFKDFIGFTKKFVRKLRELGIEPVFYFDGPTIEAKKDCRKRRNSVKARLLSKIFSVISGPKWSNSVWNSLQHGHQMLPVLISVCGRFICKYECNCTVFVSVTDCDKELADYANRESCFAILSQDTDFLCLKNATYYLSIKRLNLDDMSTLLYDRCALLAYYSFTVQQMWLFASLLGNDVIPHSKLGKFHQKLCGNNYSLEDKCNAVAWFVKKETENYRDDVEVIVPAIVEYLDTLNLNITASDLRASLRSYQPSEMENWIMDKDIEEPWLQVLEMAYLRHVECEAVPDVYNTLAGHPYEIGLFLEQPSTDYQAASRIYFTLRQRIYSLLLHEKPWGNTAHEVKEFGQWDNMWHDLESVDVPDLDKGINHPGLVALWSKDTQRINLQRWTLFAKAISPNLDPVVFERLSYRYVIPVAVLLYLLNLPQNEPQYRQRNQQQAQACEQQVMQESGQQQPQQRPDEKPNNGEQNWIPESHQESVQQEAKSKPKKQHKRRRKPNMYQQKQGPNEEKQQQKLGPKEELYQHEQGLEEEHQQELGPKEEKHQQKLGPEKEKHQHKQGLEEEHQQQLGPEKEKHQYKQGLEEEHQQQLGPEKEKHQYKQGLEEEHQQQLGPEKEKHQYKQGLEEEHQQQLGPEKEKHQHKQGLEEEHQQQLGPEKEKHQYKQGIEEEHQQQLGPEKEKHQHKQGLEEEHQQQLGPEKEKHQYKQGLQEEHQQQLGPEKEKHQYKQRLEEEHQQQLGPEEAKHQHKQGLEEKKYEQKLGPKEEKHQQKLGPKEEKHQQKLGPKEEKHQQKLDPREEHQLKCEAIFKHLQLKWGPIVEQHHQKQGSKEELHQHKQEPKDSYLQKQGPMQEEHKLNLAPKEDHHQQKLEPKEDNHQQKQGRKKEHQLKQNVPDREQQHENSKKKQMQNYHQPKQFQVTGNCYLHDNEIESFIKQAVAVMSLEPGVLKPEILLHNKRLTGRMLNLSTLFGYGISMVLFLMSVLGFPLHKVMPWYYFDGPLFHYFLASGNIKHEGFSTSFPACCDKQMQNHIMEDVEIIRAIVNANSHRGSERIQCGNGRRDAAANGDSGIEL